MMNNAITQTMKNRAAATRFVLAQGTHQVIKTKEMTHKEKKKQTYFQKFVFFSLCVISFQKSKS